MLSFVWPIALVVISNTVYQVCAKSNPEDLNPFAALIITYLVGAAASAVLYFVLNRGGNLLREYRALNWASVVLGLVIVGLEVGFIYAYRAGWQVSTAQITSSSVLAAALLIVGRLAYGESITWNKLVGMVICLAGLALVNMK